MDSLWLMPTHIVIIQRVRQGGFFQKGGDYNLMISQMKSELL